MTRESQAIVGAGLFERAPRFELEPARLGDFLLEFRAAPKRFEDPVMGERVRRDEALAACSLERRDRLRPVAKHRAVSREIEENFRLMLDIGAFHDRGRVCTASFQGGEERSHQS